MFRFSPPDQGDRQRRITSVSYRADGRELLASYSSGPPHACHSCFTQFFYFSDYIYVFDPRETAEIQSGSKLKVHLG